MLLDQLIPLRRHQVGLDHFLDQLFKTDRG